MLINSVTNLGSAINHWDNFCPDALFSPRLHNATASIWAGNGSFGSCAPVCYKHLWNKANVLRNVPLYLQLRQILKNDPVKSAYDLFLLHPLYFTMYFSWKYLPSWSRKFSFSLSSSPCCLWQRPITVIKMAFTQVEKKPHNILN